MRRWLSAWFSRASSPLCERRSQERRSLDLPVRCRRGGAQLQGTLRDVSEDGLCVRVSTQVQPGERLEVGALAKAAAGRHVTCQVVWCRRSEGRFLVGLRCQAGLYGSWLSEALVRERSFRRREHRRFAVQAPAQVGTSTGVLLDLSLGGARVRVKARPAVGDLVRLRVQGLDAVAWVVGCTLGWEGQAELNLRFLKGQELGSVRRLLKKAA